jgi:hypothetical protein
MTDDNDPFGDGIELEFDAMEARRQAAQASESTTKPEPKVTAVGQSKGAVVHSSYPPQAGASRPQQASTPPHVPGLSDAPAPASAPKAPTPKKNFDYQPVEVPERTAPPIWRSLLAFLGVLLLAGGFLVFWYRHELFPPDPMDIVVQISEGPDGELVWQGETYRGEFSFDEEVDGTVNQLVRSHFPEMPFITHEIVLASGDYLDPDMVQITELKDHEVMARSKVTNPDGELVLVYAIPADARALTDLMKVRKDQYVVVVGDVVQNTLQDPMGSVSLQSLGNAKVVRVREVLFDIEPPE